MENTDPQARSAETRHRGPLAILLCAIMAGSILAVSEMAALQPALAARDGDNDKKPADKNKAEKDDSNKKKDPNFKIKNFYRDNTNLVMKVKGVAGGTVPPKPAAGELGRVYVYAFLTNNGVWVINAHWECHEGATGCDPNETHVSEWHAEKVVLAKVDGYDKPCVTAISDERPATMDGHKAIVNVPEATKIESVQTASFNLQTNPDNPTQLCIAELGTVFDESSHEAKDD